METSESKIGVARKNTNFPEMAVAVFMFFAGLYVIVIFWHYLTIIQTYSANEYALAAWLLLVGFITTVCLLVDTAIIIFPHILELFLGRR